MAGTQKTAGFAIAGTPLKGNFVSGFKFAEKFVVVNYK
jgi:hypothetical protein